MIIFLTLIGNSKLYQHHQLNGSQTRVISELLMHKVQLWPQNISLPYSCWFWGCPVLLLTSIFSSPPQSMIRDLVMEGRTYTMHIKAVYRLDGWIYGVIWDITWTQACTGFVSLSLCALQWCMLLACTLQVYTHTHTQSQTHTFFFLFWSFRSYKHIETRSPRVCELYVPGPEERLYRCGFWFSLSELSELTHSLICLSGFSFVRLCVCVCVFKRKILHMWGATLRHRDHF